MLHFLFFFITKTELAVENGQDLKRIGFKDQSWLGLKTRSRKYIGLHSMFHILLEN